jgi:hypothetical protein
MFTQATSTVSPARLSPSTLRRRAGAASIVGMFTYSVQSFDPLGSNHDKAAEQRNATGRLGALQAASMLELAAAMFAIGTIAAFLGIVRQRGAGLANAGAVIGILVFVGTALIGVHGLFLHALVSLHAANSLMWRAEDSDGRPVSTREAYTGQAMRWWVPPRPHWHSSRHESSKVSVVATTIRRSSLARWPPQLAASQISAATRIATKITTTMTAAGIARSLWSCLCNVSPLRLMAPGHGAADKPGAAALAASAALGSACSCRTYACSIRRCVPSPLVRGPRPPPHRSGLSYRSARQAGSCSA